MTKLFRWFRRILEAATPVEIPDHPHCPICNSVGLPNGESGSTAEARYFCLTCNQHFFHGGWGSGMKQGKHHG